MTTNAQLGSQIAKHADALHLRKTALEHGMLTLKQHGTHLIRAGITTVPEVLRVCRKFE